MSLPHFDLSMWISGISAWILSIFIGCLVYPTMSHTFVDWAAFSLFGLFVENFCCTPEDKARLLWHGGYIMMLGFLLEITQVNPYMIRYSCSFVIPLVQNTVTYVARSFTESTIVATIWGVGVGFWDVLSRGVGVCSNTFNHVRSLFT